MLANLLNTYEKFSVADSYIFGFIFDKKIYMVKLDNIDESLLTEEKASRNQGTNLRLRIRKAHKEILMGRNPICLGNKEDLVQEKYNKGEIFEKLVTEHFGQSWVKDNVPFYKDGDINVNGEKIQIKFDGATFLNSKQAERLQAVA